jgi:protein-S-isoprenylcysteine O-methyltransferase
LAGGKSGTTRRGHGADCEIRRYIVIIPDSSVVGGIYFVSEWALILTKRAKSGAGGSKDRGSFGVLMVVIWISIALAYQFEFAVPQTGWPPVPWISALGIAVMIGGLAIRWYSIIYLGRFFTVNVAIAADHQLIDTGPYRWLRHPSYTGALLAFLGLAICMQNWASLVILMTGTTAAFLYRMRVEEAALTGAFGERYRLYMQHTARLVPGLY